MIPHPENALPDGRLRRESVRAVCAVVALSALAFIASPVPAGAQADADGIIPLPEQDAQGVLSAMDSVDLSARSDAARRVSEASTVADPDRESWISPLRLIDLRYPLTDGVVRITGERQWVSFDLYAADPAKHDLLRVTTLSGINNLAERSYFRVEVNGVDIGRQRLEAVEDFGPTDIGLPPDVLQSGRNRVVIELRQHHRIYCGPEAAFDLWTDIDLSRSGLVVPHPRDATNTQAFLMALSAQATSAQPVEVRGLDSLGADAGHWRKYIVSHLNQLLSGPPVAIRFTDYWTVATTDPAHARITIIPAARSNVRFQTAGDGALVLVLEVAQDSRPEDIFGIIAQIEARAAHTQVPLVTPERDVPISELGVATENFSQHYAVRNHVFRLPADWLVLTAAKARINLDYAYATNLPEGATLLLKVNGAAIRLLPLRGQGGQPITAFPIDFEARLLHPGTNLLTFEMFVPGDPPDLPCAAGDAPMLQISENTTLRVPYSPSMAMPDMDLAFSALGPDSLQMNDMSGRAFSEMDALTLSAALSQSRAPIRPSTLHLIAIDDLGSLPTAHYHADRRLLEDTVLTQLNQSTDLVSRDDTDPFNARRPQSMALSTIVNQSLDEIRHQARRLTDRLFPNSGDQLNAWLAEHRGQAVLFQLDPDRPDEIWMLRNPDSDITDITLAIASARSFGGGPKGQVSVLSHEGIWMNWFAPDRRPILLEPWTLQNFRSAMGNFFSARPIVYTILMLGIAFISALVALRLVMSTRDHKA